MFEEEIPHCRYPLDRKLSPLCHAPDLVISQRFPENIHTTSDALYMAKYILHLYASCHLVGTVC